MEEGTYQIDWIKHNSALSLKYINRLRGFNLDVMKL